MFSVHQFHPVGCVTNPIGLREKAAREDIYLFDLDVLCETRRGWMSDDFASYLEDFTAHRSCYVLSSLNYTEVLSRIPTRLHRAFTGVFASSGTELWCGHDLKIRHEYFFSDDLYEFVAKTVMTSRYPEKQAPLIDNGPATLRICIAGTKIGQTRKSAYLEWDQRHRELDAFIEAFRTRFPDHSIFKDDDASLLITPNSFSTALVQDHILRRHKSARIVAYLSKASANGFAKPLCDAFLRSNVLSTVGGTSDVSQLLSYEKRQSLAKERGVFKSVSAV